MDLILPAIGLLILLAGGLGVTLLILPREREAAVAEILSLALLTGAGVVSITCFVLGLLVSGGLLRALVTAVCIGLGATGVYFGRRRHIRVSWPLPEGWLSAFLTVVVVIQATIVFWLSYHFALGWDGLLNWEMKARIAYLNHGVIPASFLRDPGRAFGHPRYPLLIPLTEAWFYGWMGIPDQQFIKLLFPLFYLAGVSLLVTGCKVLGAQTWQKLMPAVLLVSVPLAAFHEGSSTSGYADFPLAVYYLAAVVYLVVYWEKPDRQNLLTVGVLGALIPWVKQEGNILWLVLMGLAAAKAFSLRQYRSWLLAAIPGLLVIAGWRLYLNFVGAINNRDFVPVSPSSIRDGLHRLPAILHAVSSEMLRTRYWGVWWLAILCAIIVLLISNNRLKAIPLIVAIALPIALYTSTYLFSTWTDVAFHIANSFPRLLVHVFLLGGLVIGVAVADLSRRIGQKRASVSLRK